MSKIDLGFAMGLPPQKAIDYFKSKDYAFGFNWSDVWEDAHSRSFTVAGIMKQDILQDIKHSLTEAMQNGESFQTWRDKIELTLGQKGWLGYGTVSDKETGEVSKQLAPHRMETIYRTNMQSAMMAGRYQTQMSNIKFRPYGAYSAVMDNRTRPKHAAMNGTVLPLDDPFWSYFYPPNGWGCRCTVRTYSERDIQRKGLTVYHSSDRDYEIIEQPINLKGDTRPTVAFKNPNTGKMFMTDAGFNYNSGMNRYLPDLNQYDTPLAKQFIQESVSGPDFKYRYKKIINEVEKNVQAGMSTSEIKNVLKREFNWPIAKFADNDVKKLGLGSQTVTISDQVLVDQVIKKHQEYLGVQDYLQVQPLLDNAQLIAKTDHSLVFIQENMGVFYQAIIQSDDLVLTSFEKISTEQAKQSIQGANIIKDILHLWK
ncbi:phage head morphogenesis protein [Neisseria sp. Ec49-e6-T10]|uniref:phage head morphogenesis protein n=1 Tax=Neisseria sp. Ec49-e6-T10 TaxID=3140744 RepID=UPI003EBB61CF